MLMSENVPDEERLASEINLGNQPVLVSGNVKYNVRAHPVRTTKYLPNLMEAVPLASGRNTIPIIESRARFGMCCLELSDRLVANNVHALPSMFP